MISCCILCIFTSWIRSSNHVTRQGTTQGHHLHGATENFPDDATAEAWFVEARWPEGVTCPHCGSANVKTGAQHHSMPFRCRQKGCAKRFSTRTGTVMECSKEPLKNAGTRYQQALAFPFLQGFSKGQWWSDRLFQRFPNLGFQVWAIAVFLVATNLKGISSMKLHRGLGVTRKTAWFLAHRIRETWQDASAWFAWLPGFNPFDGPMEADETCVGGKRKNMSHEKRKQIRGRGTIGKVAVAGVKDRRTGKVSARVVQHTDSVTLQGFVQHHATPCNTRGHRLHRCSACLSWYGWLWL